MVEGRLADEFQERQRIAVALDALLAVVAIAIRSEERAAQLAEATPPVVIHTDWLRRAS
jgi:hypothetical protein